MAKVFPKDISDLSAPMAKVKGSKTRVDINVDQNVTKTI